MNDYVISSSNTYRHITKIDKGIQVQTDVTGQLIAMMLEPRVERVLRVVGATGSNTAFVKVLVVSIVKLSVRAARSLQCMAS